MSGKVNLDRWSPHLAAARREGKTLTQYARGRGLSRHTLYAARQMLRGEEGKPGTLRRARADRRTKQLAPSTFAAVKLWRGGDVPLRCAAQGVRAPRGGGLS